MIGFHCMPAATLCLRGAGPKGVAGPRRFAPQRVGSTGLPVHMRNTMRGEFVVEIFGRFLHRRGLLPRGRGAVSVTLLFVSPVNSGPGPCRSTLPKLEEGETIELTEENVERVLDEVYFRTARHVDKPRCASFP